MMEHLDMNVFVKVHFRDVESTTTAVDESDNGSELSDGVGADEQLIVL